MRARKTSTVGAETARMMILAAAVLGYAAAFSAHSGRVVVVQTQQQDAHRRRSGENIHNGRRDLGTSPATHLFGTTDDQSASCCDYALLFDCDGVILETEELHRLAYNKAFDTFDLTMDDGKRVEWSVEYYDILQNTVGGGKPKMFHYFRSTQFPNVGDDSAPTTPETQQALVDDLQAYKTQEFQNLLRSGDIDARPGLLDLMDEALLDPTVAVGVCSAATKAAAEQTLAVTLGPERIQQLDVLLLGDDVDRKKPDPLIYNTARERLVQQDKLASLDAPCIVVEDSLVGLRAAVAANMRCIITYTSSTASQDFYGEGAAAKVPDLGSRGVTLDAIFGPLRKDGNDAEILKGLKDE